MLTDVKKYEGIGRNEDVSYYKEAPISCYIFNHDDCYGKPKDLYEGVSDRIKKTFKGYGESILVLGIDQDGEFGVLDIYIGGIYNYSIKTKEVDRIPKGVVKVAFDHWKYPVYLDNKGGSVRAYSMGNVSRQFVPPDKVREFKLAGVPLKQSGRGHCDWHHEMPYLLDRLELNQAKPLHRGKWDPSVATDISKAMKSNLIIRRGGNNILWETRSY